MIINRWAEGAQWGHAAEKVEDTDEVKMLKIYRRNLPKWREHQEAGYEARQVIELDISDW